MLCAMNWWIWTIVGLGLALVEIATPGFFFIFLAVGAFVSAALLLAWPDMPLWGQVLTFSVFSVGSLVFFRKPLMRRFGLDKPAPSRDEIIHESATPLDDILPGGIGKAELRGTSWTARNGGTKTLVKGQNCKVERVEGLTLWLISE
jgi:membrane protein implicated in regulation of membrane protease activity